jgi:hypothetical protein
MSLLRMAFPYFFREISAQLSVSSADQMQSPIMTDQDLTSFFLKPEIEPLEGVLIPPPENESSIAWIDIKLTPSSRKGRNFVVFEGTVSSADVHGHPVDVGFQFNICRSDGPKMSHTSVRAVFCGGGVPQHFCVPIIVYAAALISGRGGINVDGISARTTIQAKAADVCRGVDLLEFRAATPNGPADINVPPQSVFKSRPGKPLKETKCGPNNIFLYVAPLPFPAIRSQFLAARVSRARDGVVTYTFLNVDVADLSNETPGAIEGVLAAAASALDWALLRHLQQRGPLSGTTAPQPTPLTP